MVDDPIEWEFGVPASQVDLERIERELRYVPAAMCFVYLDALKTNAPTVYGRFAKRTNQTAMAEGSIALDAPAGH